MRYILNKYHHNIPDEVLLSDIKITAKKLGSGTVTRAMYTKHGTYCKTTIVHRFGSWNRALSLAGLGISKLPFITTAQLMQNLKHVWDTLSSQPRAKDMVPPVSSFSADSYVRRYGSWSLAVAEFVKLESSRRKLYKAYLPHRVARRKKKRLTLNITKSMRYDILKRDDFRCRLCGASPAVTRGVKLHVDHIIPCAKGGETVPQNLQTLCSECNYGKGAK